MVRFRDSSSNSARGRRVISICAVVLVAITAFLSISLTTSSTPSSYLADLRARRDRLFSDQGWITSLLGAARNRVAGLTSNQEPANAELDTQTQLGGNLSAQAEEFSSPSQHGKRVNPQEHPLCTPHQWGQGAWHERFDPPQTLEGILDLFSWSHSNVDRLRCAPPGSQHGASPLEPAYQSRLLRNAEWQYRPPSTCQAHKIANRSFIKRLLRSRAGLILVGDSLTEHHAESLFINFIDKNDLFRFGGHGSRPRYAWVKLNPYHDETEQILREAGVSRERLEQPLVSLYLERHLLSLDEIPRALSHIGARYNASAMFDGDFWVKERIWLEEVRKHLNKPSTVLHGEEEATILLLNTGPHWIDGEFVVKGAGMTDEETLEAYEKMLFIVDALVKTLPRSAVTTFWRSTLPGHPECETFDHPEPLYQVPATPKRYQWHLFPHFNRLAEEITHYRETKHSHPSMRSPAAMEYLDVWDLSRQRPDSHALPPIDCLHYCTHTVSEQITEALWHRMIAQSRHTDYSGHDYLYL